MTTVRIATELAISQVIPFLRSLIRISGLDPWRKKYLTLRQQLRENSFLKTWQEDRHRLELTLGDLISEEERTGRFPLEIMTGAQYKLYAFAASFVRIYDQLSKAGQTRLRGMLLHGLHPGESLLSLQHEVLTIFDLVSQGFDVELNDIENGQGGADFIARRDGIEIEIECKMFSGDLGRKIHNLKAYGLHKRIEAVVQQVYQSAERGIFIRITIPDRLSSAPLQLNAIETALSRGVLSGNAVTSSAECEVEVLDFQVGNSPFGAGNLENISLKSIQDFTLNNWRRVNQQMMIMFSPGKRAVIALIESAKPDAVQKGISRQLREASKTQFTKRRPGYLYVQFQEMSGDQLEDLANRDTSERANATGLQKITNDFLRSDGHSHMNGVIYRSNGKVVRPANNPHAWIEEGPAYIFKNETGLFARDSRYDLLPTFPTNRIDLSS